VTQASILLGAMPRMMRSIVEDAVASQADMRLAGTCDDGDLEVAVARCNPDVLIVKEEPDRTESSYRSLLLAYPSLKVCVLAQDGRNAILLAFRRARLLDASPTTLIQAIRSALREAKPDEF
jgi:hypothetical protein